MGSTDSTQATLGETPAPRRPHAAPTASPCSEGGTAATGAVAAAATNLGSWAKDTSPAWFRATS